MGFFEIIPLWQILTVAILSVWVVSAQLLGLTEKIRCILQPLVNRQVDKEVSFLLCIQTIQHPFLDIFFTLASYIVSVEFYTAFLPLLFWSGHDWLARQMTLLMALCLYTGNSIKDLVSARRPPSPPVRRLTKTSPEVKSSLEYGLPSSHTINTICFSMYLFRFIATHVEGLHASVLWIGGLLLLITTILVVYGRMYLGMHSPIDILAGAIVGISLAIVWCYVEDYVDKFIMKGKSVFIFSTIMAVLLLIAYPTPEKLTPSFEDHTAFNGVVLGMIWGVHLKNFRHLQGLVAIPSPKLWSGLALVIKRLFVGLPIVIAAKYISKFLALKSIPWTCAHVGLPIRSSTYIPELNGLKPIEANDIDLDPEEGGSDGLWQSFGPHFVRLGDMGPFDVDIIIRLLQYAALSFSAVEVPYIFQLLHI